MITVITMPVWVFLLAMFAGGALGATIMLLRWMKERVERILAEELKPPTDLTRELEEARAALEAERYNLGFVERQRDAALALLETHGPPGWSERWRAKTLAGRDEL